MIIHHVYYASMFFITLNNTFSKFMIFMAKNMFEPKALKCVIKMNFTNFIPFFSFIINISSSPILRRNKGHLIRFKNIWRKKVVHLKILNVKSLLKHYQIASNYAHWNIANNGTYFQNQNDNSNYCVPFVIFQIYIIIILTMSPIGGSLNYECTLGAHTLAPHIMTRGVCKNYKMGQGKNDTHGHLLVNSFT